MVLRDENVEPIDFDTDADWIGVTGYIVHKARMLEIIERFKQRGRRVAVGGPFATLCPEELRGKADVVFVGTASRRSAHHHAAAAVRKVKDREHALAVHDVAGHADPVGVGVEVDRLDVLVTEHHLVGSGVSAASVGRARLGNVAFLPSAGRIRSNVQNDSGFLGAMRRIFIGRSAPGSPADRCDEAALFGWSESIVSAIGGASTPLTKR